MSGSGTPRAPRTDRGGRRVRIRPPRLDQLLPLACLASAGALFASEMMVTFEFVPPGRDPVAEQTAADQHGYALAIVAAFAFLATIGAIAAASKPAAIAVGVAGGVALLTFLLVDLPDAGTVGTVSNSTQSFFDAEAVPRAGFWFELVGALGLAVSGIALATLSPDQLAALRPRRRPPPPSPPAGDGTAPDTQQPTAPPPEAEDPGSTQPARHTGRGIRRYQR